MKKTLLSLALVAIAPLSYAQISTPIDNSFEFVDAEGNIVEHGSVINKTEVEESDYGDLMISSGLYVKNTTEDDMGVGLQYTIETLPSGSFQHCFPGTYMVTSAPQTNYTQTKDPKEHAAGMCTSLQSEWIVEEGNYGTCVVTYQLKVYDMDPIDKTLSFYSDGPTVTVNYIYSDPAGIKENMADKQLRSLIYYDLSGREVKQPTKGVYVKKLVYADGTEQTYKVTLK